MCAWPAAYRAGSRIFRGANQNVRGAGFQSPSYLTVVKNPVRSPAANPGYARGEASRDFVDPARNHPGNGPGTDPGRGQPPWIPLPFPGSIIPDPAENLALIGFGPAGAPSYMPGWNQDFTCASITSAFADGPYMAMGFGTCGVVTGSPSTYVPWDGVSNTVSPVVRLTSGIPRQWWNLGRWSRPAGSTAAPVFYRPPIAVPGDPVFEPMPDITTTPAWYNPMAPKPGSPYQPSPTPPPYQDIPNRPRGSPSSPPGGPKYPPEWPDAGYYPPTWGDPTPPRPPWFPPKPPGPGKKDVKIRTFIPRLAQILVGAVTEASDITEALFEALPDHAQRSWRWNGRGWELAKAPSSFPKQANRVWKNFDQINWNEAAKNLLWNAAEDAAFGYIGQKQAGYNARNRTRVGFGPAL